MLLRFITQTDIRVGITISYCGIKPFKVTRIYTQGDITYLSNGQEHVLSVSIRNGVFNPTGVCIHLPEYVNLPKEPV